jgi:hypothetical protein
MRAALLHLSQPRTLIWVLYDNSAHGSHVKISKIRSAPWCGAWRTIEIKVMLRP